MIKEQSWLITTKEVADALRVHETTVRRWAKSGAIAVIILPHTGKRQVYRIQRRILNKLLGEPVE